MYSESVNGQDLPRAAEECPTCALLQSIVLASGYPLDRVELLAARMHDVNDPGGGTLNVNVLIKDNEPSSDEDPISDSVELEVCTLIGECLPFALFQVRIGNTLLYIFCLDRISYSKCLTPEGQLRFLFPFSRQAIVMVCHRPGSQCLCRFLFG